MAVTLEEFNAMPPIDQLTIIRDWSNWEDCNVVMRPRTLSDLVEMYKFIVFTVGVEFCQSVYDLIEEEEEDGETTTQELVYWFNEKIGYELI